MTVGNERYLFGNEGRVGLFCACETLHDIVEGQPRGAGLRAQPSPPQWANASRSPVPAGLQRVEVSQMTWQDYEHATTAASGKGKA